MMQAPNIVTDPRSVEKSEDAVVKFVLDRYALAERFDRPFKNKALAHWKQANNVLGDDHPYFNRFFEPATMIAHNDTIEGIMSTVFAKDTYFDLVPQDDQDELSTEMMRELMRYELREHVKYEMVKYFQCFEAGMFGNGISRHEVISRLQRYITTAPLVVGGLYPRVEGIQRVERQELEVFPKERIVSRFDAYPCPMGSTIQEMPFFIERAIIPIDAVKEMAKFSGYKNTDKLEGFASLDARDGKVGGNTEDRAFDWFERMKAIGYDVSDANLTAGDNVVKYTELLIYSEKPAVGDGCSRIVIVADRQHLLSDAENPFWHQLKPYSEIKFEPKSPQMWQARGVPEKVEQLQDKLNMQLNASMDMVDQLRDPPLLVSQSAGVRDMSDLKAYPQARVRITGSPTGIQPMFTQQVPTALLQSIDYTSASIQRTSGVNDYSRGFAGGSTGLSASTATATGISILTQASNQAKTFKWLLAEKTGITEGLQMTASLIQQTMTQPQKIRILGGNEVLRRKGYDKFMTVSPQDVAGRWQFFAIGASRAMDNSVQSDLITATIKDWMSLPEVAPRLKQLDAAVEVAEMRGFRNPRRLLMDDSEYEKKQAENPPQPPPLEPKLSISYKDLEPDIRMQLQQMFGLQPSQVDAQQMQQLLQNAQVQAALRQMIAARGQQPMPLPQGV